MYNKLPYEIINMLKKPSGEIPYWKLFLLIKKCNKKQHPSPFLPKHYRKKTPTSIIFTADATCRSQSSKHINFTGNKYIIINISI